MLYTWYIFEEQEPCHRWLMTMNYFIHVLMYTYFFMKALGLKLPKSLAMIITTLQISQMIIGVYVNWYTWRALGENV
jgi:elongation of very long chain fatty acids protein 6